MDPPIFIPLPDPFLMRNGGELRGAHIAYETWGELSPTRDNVILIFPGMSASSHAASSSADPTPGWWEKIIGPGRAIDTSSFFVICLNALGSCHGSTGPASIDPGSGAPYRLKFPTVAVEDMARSGFELLRALDIKKVDTVIGPSLGGMAGLAFITLHPGVARGLITISSSAAASPFAIAMRSLQREAVMSDPNWCNGNYEGHTLPRSGMQIARKLGMLTYRGAAEWTQRFGREMTPSGLGTSTAFSRSFSVESYLAVIADAFVESFDPNSFLFLSRAIDHFDLAEHGGSDSTALIRSRVERGLVIGIESDLLFGINEQRSIAMAFRTAGIPVRFAQLACEHGHDSFLIDTRVIGEQIAAFLENRWLPSATSGDEGWQD